MLRPQFALAVIAICVLTGCATRPRDPLTIRQQAYERLASFLEPGMTRRQLYALLPPQRPARTNVPGPGIFMFGLPGPAGYQSEHYPLDPDFQLNVELVLAKSPAASASWSFLPVHASANRSGPLRIQASAIDFSLDPAVSASLKRPSRTSAKTQRTGNVCISANATSSFSGGRPET
jgi:hypothetical protein